MVTWSPQHTRGTLDERVQRGLDAQRRVPHEVHADLYRAQARPEPVAVIAAEAEGRAPQLVAVRHSRMADSIHDYFRGTPGMMAADLSVTPVSGIAVQALGDAEILNFRTYSTHDQREVLGPISFDETLRGPWEWDVKRLATSVVVAARSMGVTARDQRTLARATLGGYRRGMGWAVRQDRLRLWFTRIPDAELERGVGRARKPSDPLSQKLDLRDLWHRLEPLTEVVGATRRLVVAEPALVPLTQWMSEGDAVELHNSIPDLISAYASTVNPEMQELLNEYRPVDAALRFGGVSGIGLRWLAVLLQGAQADEWMIVSMKEARPSVLQPYVTPEFRHRGSQARRIVLGQALLQAATDPLLGWARSADRDYVIHQIWPTGITALNVWQATSSWARYARVCGFALARAHALTGDRFAIDAYIGDTDSFEKAAARYAVRYADLVESDYKEFCKAVADGALPGTQ